MIEKLISPDEATAQFGLGFTAPNEDGEIGIVLLDDTQDEVQIEALPAAEQKDLERYEQWIEEGKNAMWSLGKALSEIRDRKLYRGTHRKFAEYCLEKFGFTSMQARRLIKASKVEDNMKRQPNGAVPSKRKESHYRWISDLPAERQVIVGKKVKEMFGDFPTGEQWKQVREELFPPATAKELVSAQEVNGIKWRPESKSSKALGTGAIKLKKNTTTNSSCGATALDAEVPDVSKTEPHQNAADSVDKRLPESWTGLFDAIRAAIKELAPTQQTAKRLLEQALAVGSALMAQAARKEAA